MIIKKLIDCTGGAGATLVAYGTRPSFASYIPSNMYTKAQYRYLANVIFVSTLGCQPSKTISCWKMGGTTNLRPATTAVNCVKRKICLQIT